MEQFNEQRQLQKHLRRCFRPIGWSLVICFVLMNAVVIAVSAITGTVEGEGWGYILAVVIEMLLLLIWKKPRFWCEEIWARGKPMGVGTFFRILCVFLGAQLIYQTMVTSMELFLNSYGFTMIEGLEAMAPDLGSFSMFLYGGIAAPIAEEILFRGLIQRSLMPYGRRFAILCSSFCFGIFHGNLIQTPYAFLVGLVLGYVAAEYNIGWAMVLHMVNNLVIADMLTRLTMGLDEVVAGIIVAAVIWVFAACAIAVLIRSRRRIQSELTAEKIDGRYLRCFFINSGMIVLMVVLLVNIFVSFFLMIGPLSY